MENPVKMDDLAVPLFLETPKCLDYEPFSQLFHIPAGFLLEAEPQSTSNATWVSKMTTTAGRRFFLGESTVNTTKMPVERGMTSSKSYVVNPRLFWMFQEEFVGIVESETLSVFKALYRCFIPDSNLAFASQKDQECLFCYIRCTNGQSSLSGHRTFDPKFHPFTH